ncbi:MAG: hypothetical protein R8K46_07090 [Mariprofundaceae bacterium]
MVENDFVAPVGFIVATGALLSLLALVNVILLMAGITAADLLFLLLHLLRNDTLVAALAIDLFMFAPKFEIGFIMVEFCFFPLFWRMAGLTLVAKAAFMLIIIFVAVEAFLAALRLINITLGMTAEAGGFFVAAGQLEFGFVMIEHHVLPVLLSMAILAFLAKSTTVHVVNLMASETGGGDILVQLIRVAADA